MHDVSLFSADPVKILPLELRHELVQSIDLLALSAGHQAPVLKMGRHLVLKNFLFVKFPS